MRPRAERFTRRFKKIARSISRRFLGVELRLCHHAVFDTAKPVRKTGFCRKPKAGLPVGKVGLSLLLHHLLVVMVVPVMMADVVAMMIVAVMLCMQRRGIGAAGADDRHRDGKCDCESESGQKGLLHD
ncbi:conserved hypothetical protein [Mesorhizobium sp. STM 4661]|nr:conserved hypothetical protein [Mesorhizobium sp. STM 4661]